MNNIKSYALAVRLLRRKKHKTLKYFTKNK
jgi:hypothetical protein